LLTLTLTSLKYSDPEIDIGLEAPAGHTGPIPAGLAFAHWFQRTLPEALDGVGIGEFPWVTYKGHGLELSYAGSRFDLVLEIADRESATWLLTLEPRKGLLPFRRKKRAAGFEALSRRLLQHLEHADVIDAVVEKPD